LAVVTASALFYTACIQSSLVNELAALCTTILQLFLFVVFLNIVVHRWANCGPIMHAACGAGHLYSLHSFSHIFISLYSSRHSWIYRYTSGPI